MSKPLILAGFMATGKTTVGRMCAQRLGFRFVDADQEIERREGMRVADIFDTHGEDYFRGREAELVREVATWSDTVVATGGGMVVNDRNRRALLGAGICFALGASPDVILDRLGPGAEQERPMLRGEDPRGRVAALLQERAPAYGELHYRVDTSNMTPAQVVDRIVAAYSDERERIAVRHPSGSYDIVLGEGSLEHIGYALAGRFGSPPAAIISDSNVAPLYAEVVAESLRQCGMSGFVHVLRAGEAHKTLGAVEGMYAAMAGHGLERGSPVIALGGGVTGDAAGFAAATYLRGLPLVQIPTSLLAMADSSIGGKVGIDTDYGKNLVGAFKQPDLVWMDLDVLSSLPEVEIRCGMAEIVKAGVIAGGDAWQRVRASTVREPEAMRAALRDAILLKREIVEEDPYERGRRAHLNLGHTFGHALESWSTYGIRHGLAVALGMVCAARLSQAEGLCDAATAGQIEAAIANAGLPTALAEVTGRPGLARADIDAIVALMGNDKKRKAGRLRFILVRAPGDLVIRDDVAEDALRAALASL